MSFVTYQYVVWFIFGTLALALHIRALLDACDDLEAVVPHEVTFAIIAHAAVRREVLRIIGQSLFLVTGMLAALSPATHSMQPGVTERLGAFALVSAQFVLLVSTILDRRMRAELLAVVRPEPR